MAGVAVGILALTVTCFAYLSTLGLPTHCPSSPTIPRQF